MEVVSIIISSIADVLGWIYLFLFLKNFLDKLNLVKPNVSAIEIRMHIAFGIILLKGFCLVIGTGRWISWIIWLCAFILNIIEFKNAKS